MELFRPYMRQLTSLKSLQIGNYVTYDFDYKSELNKFLHAALSLPSLSELSVLFLQHTDALRTISTWSALSKLTSLTSNDPYTF
jgi:hypothetical protein